MLTPAQRGEYEAKGFIAIERVFSAAELEELRQVTDEFIERSRTIAQSDDVFDVAPGHSAEHPRVRRIKDPAKNHPTYYRILRDDRVLDAVADVVGPSGIRLIGTKLNTKTGSAGAAGTVEWHQDFAFYPYTNADVTAAAVYIDDSTVENGCMLMIPGSQRGPVLDHHRDGMFVGAVDSSRGETDFSKAVPIEVRAGGISLHHGHMLHASAPNRSMRPRRLLIFELVAGDAWPLLGIDDLDAFNSRLLRGNATLTPRVEAVHVRIPLPEPAGTSTIFEMQELARASAFDSAT